MIIIHIVPNLGWGGVESIVRDLSIALKNETNEVHIISLFRNKNKEIENKSFEEINEKGVNVHFLYNQYQKNNISVFYRLRKILKRIINKNPVILNMHLKWGVLAGVLGSIGKRNIIRIETYHSNYSRYRLQAFTLKSFIDGYIAVSNDAAKELIIKFNINIDKVTTIYNGVNSKEIRDQAKDFLQEDYLKILSSGRLSEEKGFIYSVMAFNLLLKKNSSVRYKHIGDGPCKESIISLTRDERFILEGYMNRSNLFEKIYEYDVVIMPSLWEGNSIFLLEVLTVGKPVIITDIPSFREVFSLAPLKDELFRPFDCGVLVKVKDPESIAAGIDYLCKNTDKLRIMADNSYNISKDFDIDIVARRYITFYKKIISDKSGN